MEVARVISSLAEVKPSATSSSSSRWEISIFCVDVCGRRSVGCLTVSVNVNVNVLDTCASVLQFGSHRWSNPWTDLFALVWSLRDASSRDYRHPPACEIARSLHLNLRPRSVNVSFVVLGHLAHPRRTTTCLAASDRRPPFHALTAMLLSQYPEACFAFPSPLLRDDFTLSFVSRGSAPHVFIHHVARA